MFTSRKGLIGALAAASLLAALSVVVQMERDRRYATDRPAEEVMYVQSPEIMKRLVLSYDAIAADLYWIRAIQHFGRERHSIAPERRYALLYPLLDLATSLDSRFNLAYRFGAIFLSEPPPGGPGQPDQAIALLEKGIKAMPHKWQYYQDAGFVNYWARHDYAAAADWFLKGTRIKGAPFWMKSLAAATLTKGNDRSAARLMYTAMLESGETDFIREDAARRLRQLDALDEIDALKALIRRYREHAPAGQRLTWQALGDAGLLRSVPQDPDGFDLLLDPVTGDVRLNPDSTLGALWMDNRDAVSSAKPSTPPAPVPWPSPIGSPPLLGSSPLLGPEPPLPAFGS
jgi:hypothetical protein